MLKKCFKKVMAVGLAMTIASGIGGVSVPAFADTFEEPPAINIPNPPKTGEQEAKVRVDSKYWYPNKMEEKFAEATVKLTIGDDGRISAITLEKLDSKFADKSIMGYYKKQKAEKFFIGKNLEDVLEMEVSNNNSAHVMVNGAVNSPTETEKNQAYYISAMAVRAAVLKAMGYEVPELNQEDLKEAEGEFRWQEMSYTLKLKLKVNKYGQIVEVTDNGTVDAAGGANSENGKYVKNVTEGLTGNLYQRYVGMTADDVYKLDMTWNGLDTISGATYVTEATQIAVLDALKKLGLEPKSKDKKEKSYKEIYKYTLDKDEVGNIGQDEEAMSGAHNHASEKEDVQLEVRTDADGRIVSIVESPRLLLDKSGPRAYWVNYYRRAKGLHKFVRMNLDEIQKYTYKDADAKTGVDPVYQPRMQANSAAKEESEKVTGMVRDKLVDALENQKAGKHTLVIGTTAKEKLSKTERWLKGDDNLMREVVIPKETFVKAQGESVDIKADAKNGEDFFREWKIVRGDAGIEDKTKAETKVTLKDTFAEIVPVYGAKPAPANSGSGRTAESNASSNAVTPAPTAPTAAPSVTVKNEAAKELVKNITDRAQANDVDKLVENVPATEKKAALKALTADTKMKLAAAVLPKFTDVQTGQWYSNDLAVVVTMGLVQGTSATTVSPAKNVTGQEIMAMLVRSMGKEVTPVSGANWYDAYKGEATTLKLDEGIKFDVAKDLTRAEVAALMFRYVKLNEKEAVVADANALANVKDMGDIPAEYKDAVAYMFQKGLLKGYEDGTFAPNKTVSRVEVASILARLLAM